MRTRLAPSLLLVLLLWPSWVHAQLIVHDPGNAAINSVTAGQSTITAIQSTISAIEDVLQTGYMVINLTPVEGVLVADGISADMAALADIVSQAEGLSYDISSLQSQISALFDLDNPPTTSALLYERLREIRRVRHLGHSYALRVQTLLMTTLTHRGPCDRARQQHWRLFWQPQRGPTARRSADDYQQNADHDAGHHRLL